MFETKTLFIVGAGASCELGLPSGAELKHDIANRLNIQFSEGWQQDGGDRVIVEALRTHVSRENLTGGIDPFLDSARLICEAMPQAISIDNFIDAHNENDRVALCGKLSIVRSILAAERNSSLYVHPEDGRLRFDGLRDTWHTSFFKMATEGVRRGEIEAAFENVSFICFNYDRCIEHFLVQAICNYYGVDEASSQSLASKVRILHPYGVVGCLPWQKRGVAVPYGAELRDIHSIYPQVKTFNERIEDEAAITALREEVEGAETIVFLGFAFHRQNMELLKPRGSRSGTTRVFATGLGMSQPDCDAIDRELIGWLSMNKYALKREVRKGVSCSQLFSEYWRALPRKKS